jgi:hypothetical protein
VSRLRPFLIAALLACWLPATVHCALEAAELMDVTCCSEDFHPVTPHETSDHCNGWEETLATAADPLSVKAPSFVSCLCQLCCAVAPALPRATVEPLRPPPDTAPPDLTRWQFEHRTALPARAPSLA